MSYVTFDTGNADLGGLTVHALDVAGSQSLSSLFEYRVDFAVDSDAGLSDDAIDPLLRAHVRLSIGRESESEVHGVVCTLQRLSNTPGDPARYVATVVPRLCAKPTS